MHETALSQRRDLYQEVAGKISAAMNTTVGKFQMPWHSIGGQPAHLPQNAITDACYRGVNVLLLWAEAIDKAYPTGHWASYRQWQRVGSQVRKGERGTTIVFYKRMEKSDASDDTDERPRFVMRASQVFNAAQVDVWQPPTPPILPAFEREATVEAFIAATQARVRHGFNVARYRHDLDDIEMPSPAWFMGTDTRSPKQSYYAVLLHELTHWTGAGHRLARAFGKRFGDQAYAFEELVAEFGAAFLCAALGIANEPRPDHAQYLKSWLSVLHDDPKALFHAARLAQEAAEYLANIAS